MRGRWDGRCHGGGLRVGGARVEVITDEHRCDIDPCSPAVIGRCSQCALVSVDRATIARVLQKCRPPMMDCSHSFHDGAPTPYAVWYSAIAITARVSVLLGCRSSSRTVK